ncbi:Nucleotide-binding universal stress protein, UspA family [Halorientalis persicus]|jgi:nucleotide-binding universal stress UspA family protein|uniref:Nucleotide-binding universal stress protein, UspA family n=1 Tax=Halorientalis persicus TaxID=1367881 RepID=A0A1H8NVZ7_9EURY|nr:universal stress protein [Halorientalis persicus]SEO33732.1 Nucleotide-binding universal stress protein, UspA family [Halorientalis persicus]
MFDTVVIATDGSESVERAVTVALDLAAKFDAEVHALYVIDGSDVEGSPEQVRAELRDALEDAGEEALETIVDHADREVNTAVREGKPVSEICRYVEDFDADVIAMGTRGRHGEHSFLLGSVAEGVVRRCPTPVLTVRQLDADEEPTAETPA